MNKRTLYFGKPARLSLRLEQLVIRLEDGAEQTVPVEDTGLVILDHPQITVTLAVLQALAEHNIALIPCSEQHLPLAWLMPLSGHSLQTARIRYQVQATEPLKKNLWAQTVKAKILNQALLLEQAGKNSATLRQLLREITSGDTRNCEARAAAAYWPELFGPNFVRDRHGLAPNHLLNYGYAVLRALVARALVGSGLLPIIGIFHRNQYNPYCLADDIMEPYRPWVDSLTVQLCSQQPDLPLTLTWELRRPFLDLPNLMCHFPNERCSLLTALTTTTASLAACLQGRQRRLAYPLLYD